MPAQKLRQLSAGRAGPLKLGLTNKKSTQTGKGEQQYRQRAAKLHTVLDRNGGSSKTATGTEQLWIWQQRSERQ